MIVSDGGFGIRFAARFPAEMPESPGGEVTDPENSVQKHARFQQSRLKRIFSLLRPGRSAPFGISRKAQA
jgi:hypothetical protein